MMSRYSQLPPDTLTLLAHSTKWTLSVQEYVDWAGNALVDGFDSPSLRILAGLDYGLVAQEEAGDYFLRAVKELDLPIPECELAFSFRHRMDIFYRQQGLTLPDETTVAYQHLEELANQIREGVLDPVAGLDRIYDEVVLPLLIWKADSYEKYEDDLRKWYGLWDEIHYLPCYGPLSEPQYRKDHIIEFTTEWLKDP